MRVRPKAREERGHIKVATHVLSICASRYSASPITTASLASMTMEWMLPEDESPPSLTGTAAA